MLKKEIIIDYPFWENPTFIGNLYFPMIKIIEKTHLIKTFNMKVLLQNPKDPSKKLEVNGYFDTGATYSSICNSLIDKLDLKEDSFKSYTLETQYNGKQKMKSFDLMVTLKEIPDNTFFCKVAERPFFANNIDFIIGLDIILKGTTNIFKNEKGETIFTFEIPKINT